MLKQVLSDFALISGLKCNTDKSVIMQIGNKIQISEEIKNLGFAFDDKIKILGMEIDSELENLDINFSNALIAIKKSINFWERLNLSLQGRINVAKSLLFSQIIYLGSILMPSRQKINELQNSLDYFCLRQPKFRKEPYHSAYRRGRPRNVQRGGIPHCAAVRLGTPCKHLH
jgi:hypothetical protein